MKRTTTTLLAAAMSAFMATAQTTVDTYRFVMNLKVPRIYDNMQSMGYRKIQTQRLIGELQFIYRENGQIDVKVMNLVNNTHRINGFPISYDCYEYPYEDHWTRVVCIGSNKTGKFNQGGVEFAFQADPSYNIGDVDEDNTLLLELSGYGSVGKDIIKSIRGTVKGQVGCGCQAYGHISPTRLFIGHVTDIVTDVAPLYGTFSARFRGRRVE